MNFLDLLMPWFTLAAILIPLVYAEKWIHSHLYGVGWLFTQDDQSATALYYVLLFPGVFLHEFTQYLMAGALNVKIKRIIQWPEAQKDGTLRLDFVQIQEAKWFQAAIIGATPLIIGLALVWVMSSQVLSLDQVVAAIEAQDGEAFQVALKNLASTPDFFLWLYLIFTISNAMLPTPADRQGWPLLLALFAGIIGLLVLIGVGEVLYEKATGPLALAVENVTTAFAMVLVVEVPGILFIRLLEEVLERITKREFQYNRGRDQSVFSSSPGTRVPGSNIPLPPGVPMPSIYNLDLPVPLPSKHPRRSSGRRATAVPSASSPATQAAPDRGPRSPDERRARPLDAPRPDVPRGAAPDRGPRLPDERRARPLDAPRGAASDRGPGPTDERRARPLDPPRRDMQRRSRPRPTTDLPTQADDSQREDQDRTRFARSSQSGSRTPYTRPGEHPAGEVPDRYPRRASRDRQARDQQPDDDQTQRLDRTGRIGVPDSNRPRPDMQRRRPSPFDELGDESELSYEDDPDVVQDIPDDDMM